MISQKLQFLRYSFCFFLHSRGTYVLNMFYDNFHVYTTICMLCGENMFQKIEFRLEKGPCSCVFIDEAQFLSEEQVWQLARVVDDLKVPVMCYGLRVDFQGKLFPGSAALLALADEMREIKTICHCGKKATMVIRQDENGTVIKDGAQIQIGGNETYISLCRRHWREAIGD